MLQKYPLISAVWAPNRGRIMVIGLLSLCVVAAYVVQSWVTEPNLLELRTEQSRLQQQVRQRQLEFANSGVPVSAAEQLDRNLQQFNQLIPQQADFSVFLGELFDWSQQADLKIHQINYQPKQDKETGFLRYGLSFSVKGEYAQIKKFIHLVENSRRIILIEKISLRGSSTSQKGQPQVDLQIELATYFQRGRA
ncbi:type 4a pilus biogenesis protein PilO [uncultured Desulfuromusa sp.]|uniref:type 4a pilus biogenesis protein PilO n=1 Tax=uncultured Desulfuromusa sp. TaxID=219183 RepID=UPI002AA7BD01|nr:type 4a pilus biogenesis protein PilO [uncultured Desulfuromusa sp.]